MKKGFTLIEMLIYLVLVSIILGLVVEGIVFGLTAKKKTTARHIVDENIDFALKKIENSIKSASQILYPELNSSSSTLTLLIDNITTTYYLENDYLMKKVGDQDPIPITSSLVKVDSFDGNLFSLIKNPYSLYSVLIKMKVSYRSEDPSLSNIEQKTKTAVALRSGTVQKRESKKYIYSGGWEGILGILTAGGSFSQIDISSAPYIAQWDGIFWSGLGSGMGYFVRALTTYNGNLIAGGDFTQAGGQSCNRIAQWNGSSWSCLGSGMNNNVWALTTYNENLIAGGLFTHAGGQNCNFIAQWNGSSWSCLGSGMGYSVFALTTYNGNLIAGGDFNQAGDQPCNRIAQWNGSSWSCLGSGMNNFVRALTIYNGNLIAGGYFTQAGGQNCKRIAQWNGSSWSCFLRSVNGYGEVKALVK